MSVAVHSHSQKKTAGRSAQQAVARRSHKPVEAERKAAIAVRAYFMAEQRGFEPGHELEDWLNAEQQEKCGH